jgi:hypothetical protein
MNRRSFLAASMAMAAQQAFPNSSLRRSLHALVAAQPAALASAPPRDLLTSTYSEAFLTAHLQSANQWRPYPRWSDRAAWLAVPADIRAALLERAQADQKAGWSTLLASTFLDFKRNGNRTRYEAQSFGRRDQLIRLVLAECLEGQGRFLDSIADGVWLICEESFWGVPAHLGDQRAGVGLPDVTEPIIELFGAATAQALAWTRYLLGDQLDRVSPLISRRIALETDRRILQPARTRDDFVWMGLDGKNRHLNNWNPWINSNLLVANLVLEQDPAVRVGETVRILRSLDAFLNQYWPDAAEEEGPGYFSVSVLCYFECVSLLESATGNSTSVLTHPFLRAMGRYILAAHIAGDNYIDYGDAHVHAAPEGAILYRFGRAVHDDELAGFGAFCAAQAGLTATGPALNRSLNGSMTSISRSLPALLNADEIRTATRQDALLGDAWYPSFGLMTARQKAGSVEGMYVAVLAANNGRSHSHNDTGSFIVYQDGEPLAIDVGVEAYTAKTFSAERYSIWTMQSAFHNLPTIGGVMQHDGLRYRANGLRYETSADRASLSFDLAAAYPTEAGVKRWVRTVTLDRVHGRVSIAEDFELERPVPVSLSIMTPRRPSADKQGSIELQPVSGTARPSALHFDGLQLEPVVETIPLSDPGLRSSWGAEIYRILLKSTKPVSRGSWTYTFEPARPGA